MDLGDITAVVRPRNHWEAIDLGCLMVRRWWKPLYLGWLTITAPLFIALYVVLHEHPVIAMLIFWWLKPAYERLPLLIVSQALFGAVPRTRDAVREYFGLLPRQLFQALSIRRWVPTRSFDQPVTQLENLGGPERQRRLELLRRTAGSPAFWLTMVCVHVEMFITCGFLVLIFELVPSEIEVDWWNLIIDQDTGGLDWLSNFIYFWAIALVGPVYAVGGFSLYINRRIELEGWDIELEFRRLMRRVGHGATRIAMIVCLALACAPAELLAAPAEDKTSSKMLIEEVMSGPEFNHESVSRVPKALQDWLEEEDDATSVSSSPDWVVGIFRAIAQSVEFVLWVLVISGVIWSVYRYRDWIGQFIDRKREVDEVGERPSVMFALDVSADALGPHPIRSAEELWSRTQHREALSVLYRAALIALMDRYQCRLNESDTEGQCVARVRRDAPTEAADRFSRLTTLWQNVAYAHRIPSQESFREMCRAWSTDLTTHS